MPGASPETPDGDPDWRRWGGNLWFQNTRPSYWAMLPTGDFEMLEPWFKMYRDALPLSKARVQAYYRFENTAVFPETMYFWGLPNNGDYGWGNTAPETVNTYIRRYWTGCLELIAVLLDRFDYTQDKAFASTTLVPLADPLIAFFDQYWKRDAHGKIRFDPAQWLETWHTAANPLPEIAGLQFLLPRLLALPGSLTTEPQRHRWRRMQTELPRIPVGEVNGRKLLRPAESFTDRRNSENTELYGVFPFRIFGVGHDNVALARDTYQARTYRMNTCWCQDSMQAAYLGLGDEAGQQVAARAGAINGAYRFPAMWGPFNDWIPDQDHGNNLMNTLHYMLLQADGDRLFLLPAWPKTWDVAFKLHAPKNTVVEGVYRAGKWEKLKVTPSARLRDVQNMAESSVGARGLKLMGNRFLTLTTVVRVRQIEMTRTEASGPDESSVHTPEEARAFREMVDRSWPGARITWAFSWLALQDQRPTYVALRELVVCYHKKYGDEITFIPSGFFANMYNSRAQVNRDLYDALNRVSEMVGGGYRPRSVIAGFLAAENLRYLSEQEGIHVCQGNIWSQHAIDNGDGDGAISYPYYPSREHFLKAAQGKKDFIDCVNLDGWTCDFLTARRAGFSGQANSRLGVGPIETVLTYGVEKGVQEMLATTTAHFDEGFKLNKFAWVTCISELCLVEGRKIYGYRGHSVLPGLEAWLKEVRRRWPGARCVTCGEFGLLWRDRFKTNDQVDYRFVQRGSGFPGSETNMEIRWFMNKDFRLALLRDWQANGPELAIDFTRYDLKAQEPPDPEPGGHVRNWSLMNRLNQKGLRPEDKPIPLVALPDEDQALIRKRYPELFGDSR